jgi:RNA polymerase sigma-70 factor, ECF subfamily
MPAGQPPARGEALDERTQSLYRTLRDLAAGSLARERAGHTLQPTALVHEAWLRLARDGTEAWGDEAQFLAAGARVLRQVLVDHARRRSAAKRGGDRLRVTLDELPAQSGAEALDVLALDEALERLAEQHPRAARVVELRFFAGLGGEEAARLLGISPRTVDGDWSFARAWLIRALGGSGGGP